MRRLLALVACAALAAPGGAVSAKDRAWQQGVWRSVQISRPKIVFGLSPGRAGAPAQSGLTETRTYIIETDTLHLELKDLTTSDAPSLGAMVGDAVTFALEGNTVYIKDVNGREHGIHVTKQSAVQKH